MQWQLPARVGWGLRRLSRSSFWRMQPGRIRRFSSAILWSSHGNGEETDMPNCLQQLVAALNSKRNEMEQLLMLLKDEQRSIIEVDIAELEVLDARKRDLLGVMERGNAEYR